MRLSVRALQKIFVLFFCVWFGVFVKNVSDLPSILGDDENSPLSPMNLLVDDFSDGHFSKGRRQTEAETLENIYGTENRIRNKTARRSNKNEHGRRFSPKDRSHLGIKFATAPNNPNKNGTEFSNATNSTAFLIHNQKFHLDGDLNKINNDFYRGQKEGRRGRKKGRMGKKRKYNGDFAIEKPSLLLPTPIIVMGFPKAGTSSIFTFFQKQGLMSQHWYCCGKQRDPKKGGPVLMADCLLKNLKQNKSMFDGCGNYDVLSEINGPRKIKHHPEARDKTGYLLDDGTFDFDGPGKRIFFPQHFRIQELHDSFPNATWILNWRDFESWIESVLEWGIDDRLHEQFMNEYYMQGAIPSLPKGDNITETKKIMKKIYYDHHDMVRTFVQTHPSHTLVEVNITHENASTVLADAFGLNPKAWKNINQNKRKRKFYFGLKLLRSSFLWILLISALCYSCLHRVWNWPNSLARV